MGGEPGGGGSRVGGGGRASIAVWVKINKVRVWGQNSLRVRVNKIRVWG